jgi:glycine cleavage system aminomethyltransferase T
MERLAQRAGARFEVQDGWNVPVEYPSEGGSAGSVAWADVSHLGKWELDGVAGEFGTAVRHGEGWLCPLTPSRALLIGGSGRNYGHAEVSSQGPESDGEAPAHGIDVTTCFAALTILGPQARETIARFCAIDLRPQVSPPHSFRPGSIARQPGMILVEAEDRYLLLFGWALGEYMWTIVADAARPRGGVPVGLNAINDA